MSLTRKENSYRRHSDYGRGSTSHRKDGYSEPWYRKEFAGASIPGIIGFGVVMCAVAILYFLTR